MAVFERYDAIIIGSGQAGGPLATALVKSGRKTALIEREHIGGTCINEGCTPTKTMVASAEAAHVVRTASEYGVRTSGVSVDLGAVLARKRAIVESFRSHSLEAIQAGGVDVIMGEATFTSPAQLKVALGSDEKRNLSSPLMVIDTGSRPSMPPVPGLDAIHPLTSTTIMELPTLPAHLLILGGGYVGLEFGQMFRRFGSEVTIIQNGPTLLPREDDDVVAAITGILREDGVKVLTNAATVGAAKDDRDKVSLILESSGSERTVSGSHLLVATGRRPNVESLNLGAAGVALTERGFIGVDEYLATSSPAIYAVGDVTGGPAFTHISYDDFRILRENLIEGGHRTTRERLIPYTVFTDPQLGRVGLSEREARSEGRAIKVATIPMSSVSRAIEVGQTRGMMKAIVDVDTDHILGCAILGIDGGEVMAMIEIAMMGRIPYTALRDGIFAHPTLAEAMNTLFGSLA